MRGPLLRQELEGRGQQGSQLQDRPRVLRSPDHGQPALRHQVRTPGHQGGPVRAGVPARVRQGRKDVPQQPPQVHPEVSQGCGDQPVPRGWVSHRNSQFRLFKYSNTRYNKWNDNINVKCTHIHTWRKKTCGRCEPYFRVYSPLQDFDETSKFIANI